jgi:hypothetical protein
LTLFLATASLAAGLLFIVLGCSALFSFFYIFAFHHRFLVSLPAFTLALARLLILSLCYLLGSFGFFSFKLIFFILDLWLLCSFSS